jgi:diguanylate cyclase (GGDEF)-like protein
MLRPKEDTLIEQVMSRNVVTADKNMLISGICKKMQTSHVGSVVIVKDKIPAGIITERDIVNSIALKGNNILSQTAASIMKTPVFSLHPKEKLKKAVDYMVERRIRRLPIVKKGILAGIITYGDILRVIQKELSEFYTKTEELKSQIDKDGLTHVYSQKYFKAALDKEVERVKRYGGFLSLLMIDIDHFKKINDTYGHDAGDSVLQKTAFLIRKNTRKINLVARYGGDEFAVIAPISDIEGVRRLGERLRFFVERTKFHYSDKIIKVTLSIGAASWDNTIQDGRQLIIKADKALYKSKHSGRNAVSWI